MGSVAFTVPIVGFCCGTFDCLHPGHTRLVQLTAQHCDYLIVGLQSDPSLDRPEKNKPIYTVEERREIIAALKHVDEIIVYDREADLERILWEIQPDVRVIGSDWKDKAITAPGTANLIIWRERTDNWSSSGMRRRIYEAEKAANG